MKKILFSLIYILGLFNSCKIDTKNCIDNAIVLNINESDSNFLKKWEESSIISINKFIKNKDILESDKLYVENTIKNIHYLSKYDSLNLRLWTYNNYLKDKIANIGNESIYILERIYNYGEFSTIYIYSEEKNFIYTLNYKQNEYPAYSILIPDNNSLDSLYNLSLSLRYVKYSSEDFIGNRNMYDVEHFLCITKIEKNKITSNILTYYTRDQFDKIKQLLPLRPPNWRKHAVKP